MKTFYRTCICLALTHIVFLTLEYTIRMTNWSTYIEEESVLTSFIIKVP